MKQSMNPVERQAVEQARRELCALAPDDEALHEDAVGEPLSAQDIERVRKLAARIGFVNFSLPTASGLRTGPAPAHVIAAQLCDVPLYRFVPQQGAQGAVVAAQAVPAEQLHNAEDLALTLLRALNDWAARAGRRAPEREPAPERGAMQLVAEPVPYDGSEPPLHFAPQGFLGRTQWHPAELVHVGVLGETGSGKTVSAVLPLLRAALAYRCEGLSSAALVIDPKGDLTPAALQRLQSLGRADDAVQLGQPGAVRLRFFGPQQAGLSVRDRYFKLVDLIDIKSEGRDDIWMHKGHALCVALLETEEAWQQHAGCALLPQVCRWMGLSPATSPLQAVAVLCQQVAQLEQLRLLAALLDAAIVRAAPLQPPARPLARLASMSNNEATNQWLYESRNALVVVAPLAEEQLQAVLDLNLVGEPAPDSVPCTQLIDAGRVLLYRPQPTYVGDLCARALKAAFFQACLCRSELRRPVFYVVDEFQRFVTVQGDSAEMGFLDLCRAFRVTAVLATQNYAGLQRRYPRQADLDCLLLNLPTLLVFRTRDPMARHHLQESFAPPTPQLPHVLNVRPVARLATGECYYVAPHGVGREQMPLAA